MRNQAWYRLLGTVMILALALWSFAPAAEGPDKTKQGATSLNKGAGEPRFQVLTINNIWTWHRSDGQGNHSPSGVDGVFYPKFTGHCVYTDGVVFGGQMYTGGFAGTGTPITNQFVRVNGGTYESNHGLDEGWVVGSGSSAQPVDKNDPLARIFRIRRDYGAMSPTEVTEDAQIYYEHPTSAEVTDPERQAILNQYAVDWAEWPVQYGAPYIDRNGNGTYDAPPPFNYDVDAGPLFTVDSLISGGYDEPGVAGADPNTPADQVLYSVSNGLRPARTADFEGSLPMGIELQKTVFGYKRTDALGNVYFTLYRLINKGGVDIGGGTFGHFYIDNMYLCQWSDIDLGTAADDLAGCDSLLSLAYVYNGNAVDANYSGYGLPPPASGYDFLGGALVDAPGDSGVYDFKRVYDKKNQGMSSFAYFSAGSPYSDPPFANYDNGTGRWWKMLRGFAPTGSITTADEPYYHPPGEPITKFPFSGDPVAPSGFVDGLGTTYSFAPGDRRILLNTGPFQMGPNDTVDIYMGFVVAIGGDRLSSVSLMKAYDKSVQETFDLVFRVAKPPKAPSLRITELDGEVLLDWTWDLATIRDTEGKVVEPGEYNFEGYNLYQLPSAGSTLADATRIATYDLVNGTRTVLDLVFDAAIGLFVEKPVQFGTDAGIKRLVSLKRDYVNDIDKLYNGTPYYYAVTAYSVAALPGYTAALESAPQIFTARPKVPFGKVLVSEAGETITGTHPTGASTGSLTGIVADPSSVTGDSYRVTFNADNTWNLLNTTRSTTLLTGMTNQTGDDNYAVVDGVQFKVVGAANDFSSFQVVSNGAGALSPPEQGCFAFNANGFPFLNGADRPAERQQVGPGEFGIHTGEVGATGNDLFTYFKTRVTQSGARWSRIIPYDFEIRFTAAGGVGYEPLAFVTGATTGGTVITVPFELWNIGIATPNDPSDDYRLFPYLIDSDADGIFNLSTVDHTVSGGDNDPETDWFYWVLPANTAPGQAGYDAIAADVQANGGTTHVYLNTTVTAGTDVIRRMVLVNWNGGSVSDATYPANLNQAMPETGTTFRILTTKPNTTADVFELNTAAFAPTTGDEIAKASADKVGVFPNPYYTQNALESNRFEKFVTFNNMPPKATIRVFNLAGHLVRTLEKNNTSQFYQWNLTNERNFPISSGIYICYIDMPDLGVTKILKLAVIMEQQILDFY